MARITISEQFSDFLKKKRIALGMSQADLAEKIFGKPERETFISEIETGKRSVTLRTMDIILEALDSGIEFIE